MDEWKTTPLAEFECPRIMIEGGTAEDHVVTANGGGSYSCSCGEEFEWTDQNNWKRVVASDA
jgi:hypothetical protein